MKSETFNIDCMIGMTQYPDKYFDLAVCDPPYGINFGEFNRTNKLSDGTRVKANKYKQANWDDSTPNDEYFRELFRVSKNQIVWDGLQLVEALCTFALSFRIGGCFHRLPPFIFR